MNKEKLEKLKAKFNVGDRVSFVAHDLSLERGKGVIIKIEGYIATIKHNYPEFIDWRSHLSHLKKLKKKESKVYWFCKANNPGHHDIIRSGDEPWWPYEKENYYGNKSNWKKVKLVEVKDE